MSLSVPALVVLVVSFARIAGGRSEVEVDRETKKKNEITVATFSLVSFLESFHSLAWFSSALFSVS